jgi:hypothetical protein
MSTVPAATTVFDSAGTGDPALVMGTLSVPSVRPFFVVVCLVQRVDDILLVAVKNYVVLFFIGGMEASVEIRQIFEAVQTHIHRSLILRVVRKIFFFSITDKRFFLTLMSRMMFSSLPQKITKYHTTQ